MKSQQEVILKCWRELGEPVVDAGVLRQIHEQTAANLGTGQAVSPATIARAIADAGGELHHPDVLDADTEWRAAFVADQTRDFGRLDILTSGAPLTLETAEEVLSLLEEHRRQYEHQGDKNEPARLRTIAAEARRHAELLARKASDKSISAEQSEVAEWLAVWLQTPQLFSDWLELRRRSEEFRSTFSHKDTSKARRQ